MTDDTTPLMQKLLRVIHEEPGITLTRLKVRSQSVKAAERQLALNTLVARGAIREVKQDARIGRSSTCYYPSGSAPATPTPDAVKVADPSPRWSRDYINGLKDGLDLALRHLPIIAQ